MNSNDHEKLEFVEGEITIDEPGFVYIYLSNEHEDAVEVFFDDFNVTHVKSPVTQVDSYYPFGLTFNSNARENSLQNKYLFNGKELQNDLNLRWQDFGQRMYDPVLGRWSVLDPLSEKMRRHSPYNYAFDNPIRFTDPDGMAPIEAVGPCGNKPCPEAKPKEEPKKENIFNKLPSISIEITVNIGPQAGATIGDLAKADLTLASVELLKDKSSFNEDGTGEFKSEKK